MHTLVIGGGVWGCSIAYHLAKAGEKVTQVERGGLASGSTSKAAGVISPLLWSATDVALVRRSYAWFNDSCCRGEVHLHHPGEVKLVRRESEAAVLRKHVGEWRGRGLAVTLREGEELTRGFPALDLSSFAAGVFVAEAGFADTYQTAANLVRLAKAHDYRLRQGLPVTGFRTSGDRVAAVETEAGEIEADVVVLAAGTWSKKLAARAGIALPLKPYRAQALVTSALPPQHLPVVHDASSGTYFFQEEGGGILTGDGTQEAEFDPDQFDSQPDFAFVSEVTGRLQEILPAVREASVVRGWAGLCGGTPDREPLLGFHREFPNLFIACGDNGFGFMRGPALGECAAAMIRGEEPPIGLRAFDVNRFRGDAAFAIRQGYTL